MPPVPVDVLATLGCGSAVNKMMPVYFIHMPVRACRNEPNRFMILLFGCPAHRTVASMMKNREIASVNSCIETQSPVWKRTSSVQRLVMKKSKLSVGWESEYASSGQQALRNSLVRDFEVGRRIKAVIGPEETDVGLRYDARPVSRFQDRSWTIGYDELRRPYMFGQVAHVSNAVVSSTSRRDCGVLS